MMTESQALNQGYIVINEFAKEVEKQTGITKIYNIEEVITPMGGKIISVSGDKYPNEKFIKILGKNNFEITLIESLDKSFKRLLLIQALGHYMLHGEGGEKVCCVSSVSKSNASQEGFWFSLSLLIPDEIFLNVHANLDNQYLSNIFRVPKFAIEAKRKIMKQVYFDKEQI